MPGNVFIWHVGRWFGVVLTVRTSPVLLFWNEKLGGVSGQSRLPPSGHAGLYWRAMHLLWTRVMPSRSDSRSTMLPPMLLTSEPPTKPRALRHLPGFSNLAGIWVYANIPADCWSRTVAPSVDPIRFHELSHGAEVLEMFISISA